MVYCEQSMCESKLGKLMQAFRADRPDEWSMDEFIGMAEDMNKANDKLVRLNQELLAALEAAVECKMVPVSSAGEGGAAKYSIQVQVADQIRTAIAKAKGGAE